MKDRAVPLLLVAALAAAFVAPAAAVSMGCEEDGTGECCGADCAACLCCAPAPRTVLPAAGGGLTAGPAGGLGAEAVAAPPGPLPRDILHVPRPAASV